MLQNRLWVIAVGIEGNQQNISVKSAVQIIINVGMNTCPDCGCEEHEKRNVGTHYGPGPSFVVLVCGDCGRRWRPDKETEAKYKKQYWQKE